VGCDTPRLSAARPMFSERATALKYSRSRRNKGYSCIQVGSCQCGLSRVAMNEVHVQRQIDALLDDAITL